MRIATDGGPSAPATRTRPDVVTIGGLRREYVNNAIAAVRLSSLPTIVWWRGGPPEGLDGVASLADRVILDADDPWPLLVADAAAVRADGVHRHPLGEAHALARGAGAFLRSAAGPRERAPTFTSLVDRRRAIAPQAALFAGWLDASLGWRGRIAPAFIDAASGAPRVGDAGGCADVRAVLQLLPDSTCLSTEGHVARRTWSPRESSRSATRSLSTLLAEELRVRSRDIAFERAVDGVDTCLLHVHVQRATSVLRATCTFGSAVPRAMCQPCSSAHVARSVARGSTSHAARDGTSHVARCT